MGTLGEGLCSSSSSYSSSYYSSSSSVGATAHCGLGLSKNTSPFFPIYHQLSPSSHSQHLKISFYFFSPSFPGSSSLSRPFQFLSKDLFGHSILLHSLQVTQRTHNLTQSKIIWCQLNPVDFTGMSTVRRVRGISQSLQKSVQRLTFSQKRRSVNGRVVPDVSKYFSAVIYRN